MYDDHVIVKYLSSRFWTDITLLERSHAQVTKSGGFVPTDTKSFNHTDLVKLVGTYFRPIAEGASVNGMMMIHPSAIARQLSSVE